MAGMVGDFSEISEDQFCRLLKVLVVLLKIFQRSRMNTGCMNVSVCKSKTFMDFLMQHNGICVVSAVG